MGNVVHRARMACAGWCVRQGLGADDLRELLEMLGLDNGVATMTQQTNMPIFTDEHRPRL